MRNPVEGVGAGGALLGFINDIDQITLNIFRNLG
jgi:hypothetical protein